MQLIWQHLKNDVQKIVGDSDSSKHLIQSLKLVSVKDLGEDCRLVLSVHSKLVMDRCHRLLLPELKMACESEESKRALSLAPSITVLLS